jgi:predicted lipoprotein with Yx(FWY)xxD motif
MKIANIKRNGRGSLLVVLLPIMAFVLAACADTATPTATPGSAPAADPTATTAAPTATTAPTPTVEDHSNDDHADDDHGDDSTVTVDVRSGGSLGDILADGDGMALYVFDRDEPGKSNCSGGCLDAWPPLLVDDEPIVGDDVTASIGTITLSDGTKQVTINDFPAYYWQGDHDPGDTLGHGVNGVWWVFEPNGEPVRPAKVGIGAHPELGDVLVDGKGMTLYVFDRDEEGKSTRQVTVNGFPAYYWQNDNAPGDATGHGVNNVWWVFEPDGEPVRPEKVGVAEDPELGTFLVDGNGMALYIFDRDEPGVSNCAGGCLVAWPPLLTEHGVVALNDVTANVGTMTLTDGTEQVTINGYPAYYWQNDENLGDVKGHAVNNVWWVFAADGEPRRPAKVGTASHDTLGTILVDGRGMTLYIFDNDEPKISNCAGGCLTAWPPLLTDYPPVGLNGVNANIGTITRDDGSVQVTVDDWPVYFWQGDSESGDAEGQGVNGIWWVLDASGDKVTG